MSTLPTRRRSTPRSTSAAGRCLRRFFALAARAAPPGATDTPRAQANAEMWLGFGSDYRAEVDVEPSTPQEQAYPLVFLCSDAAVAVTGITMITDAGYISAGITGSFPAATPAVEFLSGAL